ncbi:hypothetical protein Ciccas_010314 [Cichlidogyrus casuarinus]|uniref:Nuclear transcription factor Y subunit gamma n=1 Tax=Cichlidogyrus casuarinus TaxID=1844966 RepID=A0ABD2PXD4_9PLAT
MQNRMYLFWESVKQDVESTRPDPNTFKSQELPLARIKKIMKLDDDVKPMMISAEAPILFAKACEVFIRELTLRAWIHTEQNRRRTLQRNDISMAISDNDTDQFDFLIDIVPREESRPAKKLSTDTGSKDIKVISGHLESPLNGETLQQQNIIVNGATAAQGIQFINPGPQVVNGQQLQYVLQLPTGQVISQQFQPEAALPPNSVLQQGPNGTFQILQLPQNNGEEVDHKMPKQTVYIQQPDGSLVPADGLNQQIIYTQGPNGQQQPMLISLGESTHVQAHEEEEGNASPVTRSAAKRKAEASKTSVPKPATKRSKPNIPMEKIIVTKVDEDSVAITESSDPLKLAVKSTETNKNKENGAQRSPTAPTSSASGDQETPAANDISVEQVEPEAETDK